MERTYNLNFDGYWREPAISGLPAQSGIYGVYAATYNQQASTVSLNRLIYIGESVDVRARVANHEKWPMWKRQLRAGEIICLNAATISGESDRLRTEAAMIFRHKPVCNDEYTQNFPFDTTTVSTTGRSALMEAHFTVYRTTASGMLGLATGRHW